MVLVRGSYVVMLVWQDCNSPRRYPSLGFDLTSINFMNSYCLPFYCLCYQVSPSGRSNAEIQGPAPSSHELTCCSWLCPVEGTGFHMFQLRKKDIMPSNARDEYAFALPCSSL